MNIIFRADASTDIGTGHIMRCLTLANLLKEKGAKVAFVCSDAPGNLIDYIVNDGFEVFPLKAGLVKRLDGEETFQIVRKYKADLLIVDHYQLDMSWELIIRKADTKIMVIDDLANREHDCDLLLDQNYFREYEKRYDGLVAPSCRKLLGPKYLLLRREFYQAEQDARDKTEAKEILIFYGGSDPTNETVKVLEALQHMNTSNLNIHVVVGQSNPEKERIEGICKEKNYHFYIQIDYLASVMAKADLSLGAGGVTMWERCFLGLPSIVTIVAENQRESTEAAADYGAVYNLDWHESVKMTDLVDTMNRLVENPSELEVMSYKAKKLMHSNGTDETHPVIEAILEVLHR